MLICCNGFYDEITPESFVLKIEWLINHEIGAKFKSLQMTNAGFEVTWK